MALVHLGKTAGSTLSGNLLHGCHMFVPHPCQRSVIGTPAYPVESTISQRTKGYYHFVPIPPHTHDGYILSSRNPIHRVVSAFLYVHPSNVALTTAHRARFLRRNRNKNKNASVIQDYDKFFTCFPNLTILAQTIMDTNNNNNDCAAFGRYVLEGVVANNTSIRDSELLNHFGFGYDYYASGLLEAQSPILVLRQEHLATDWVHLNLRLGGPVHEMMGRGKDFQGQLPVTKPPGGLSRLEQNNLCMALANEIQIYLKVIDAAINLTEEEKEESRTEIREMCPSIITPER